jgi:hypothetical protein
MRRREFITMLGGAEMRFTLLLFAVILSGATR